MDPYDLWKNTLRVGCALFTICNREDHDAEEYNDIAIRNVFRHRDILFLKSKKFALEKIPSQAGAL
jgi:hypothetical protein